jgi:hypothetical protein
MADKVVSLEFNVKTAGAVTEINKVTEATKGATTASTQYEKQLNDIKKQTDGGGFKELTRALKEYQNLALQAGESSPIGRQALSEAGELKDRLMDLKSAIKTTGQDGRALQASLQLGGGIVAGFGAVQGVMALVGSESEDLQKTLVKLQAVQATLASVEEIRSVLEKESALRITLVTLAEKARAAATVVATYATSASTVAMKAFRLALIATGIGAFVVVLGFVAEKMGLFGNATDEANEKLERQKKIREDLDASVEKDLKRNLDVRKSRQNGLNDIKAEIDILKAKGATNTEIFLAEKKLIKQQLADYAYVKTFRGYLTSAELEDQRKLQLDKYILNLKYIKDTEEANKTASEAAAAERNRLKLEADAKAKKDAEEKYRLDGERTQREYETRAEALFLLKKLDDQEKAAREETERLKIEADEKELQRQKELQTAKVNLALQGFDLINQLVNDFDNNSKASQERAFKLNKTFQLAQATIEGYRGVLKAYAEAPVGLKIASAALAAGVAAAQISKISQTKFNSAQFDKKTDTTTSNLNNTLPTNTTAPTVVGSQSTILQNNQPTTIKAIVVESDISIVQKRINSIRETARI